MWSLRTIVAATDFSEASETACEHAAALAAAVGASLHVLHVCELPVYGFEGPFGFDYFDTLERAARQRLDSFVAERRRAGQEVTLVMRRGTPWEHILAAADELRADVIVMGTRARHRLPQALVGSVAEKVVRSSKVPVLLVRADETASRTPERELR
jgi:nucleotide-binding universal stress UspA family protein